MAGGRGLIMGGGAGAGLARGVWVVEDGADHRRGSLAVIGGKRIGTKGEWKQMNSYIARGLGWCVQRQNGAPGDGLSRPERHGPRPPAGARRGKAASDAQDRPRRDRQIPRGRPGLARADERGAAEGGGVVSGQQFGAFSNLASYSRNSRII